MRSCRSCIFKIWSVLRYWGSWILRILDSEFLFHRGILEILDLVFVTVVRSWRSWILIFCFVVRSWRSWILTKWFCRGILQILNLDIYSVVGSCRSWILIFGCGTHMSAFGCRGRSCLDQLLAARAPPTPSTVTEPICLTKVKQWPDSGKTVRRLTASAYCLAQHCSTATQRLSRQQSYQEV